MGTNFYWINSDTAGIPTTERIRDHLGKRSAAGYYCWDCHVPLVEGGARYVHDGYARRFETCPSCGKGKQERERLHLDAALVELGFASAPTDMRPTGVETCCSFSFAQDPEMIAGICQYYKDRAIICDEYGRALTGQEFTDMIACSCPIIFTDSMGSDFC